MVAFIFHSDLEEACVNYRHFVYQGLNQSTPFEQLKNQVCLGDDTFVDQMKYKLDAGKDLTEVLSIQRRKIPLSLDKYAEKASDINEAIVAAYTSGGYSQKK